VNGSPPRRPLRGDLVLVRAPGFVVRPLPDGRLFLAAGGGEAPGRRIALGGVEEADLRLVLDALDGRRSVDEVLDRVAGSDLERNAVSSLLGTLADRTLLVAVATTDRANDRGGERRPEEPPAGSVLRSPLRPGPSSAPAARVEPEPAAGRLPRTVGIVGGGTAGFLAALALRRVHPEIAVTLIESPDVPVIGVGEATTPLLLQFLHADLGLDVHRLFREVRPTLKLGIRFLWGAGDGFSYPFGSLDLSEPLDLDATSLGAVCMAGGSLPILPAESGRRDGGAGPLRSALRTEVAYHLDSQRFTAYLAERAEAAGVSRLRATVDRVEPAADGRGVSALHTADGRRLTFDLYVDCSGFHGLLIGGGSDARQGAPFLPYDRSLFTDSALIGCVPRDPLDGEQGPHGPNRSGSLLPHTVAATREAGWSWAIPQDGEDHVGSVFCSAFTTPERAEAELRAAHPGLGAVRTLRFRSGRRAWFWRGNVVALGNSYGFVEPLESTAIHLAIRQILLLIDHLPLPPLTPQRGGETERRALLARLNRRVADHWDYVAWFLALHFRFNRRLETPFWRACREEVDVSRHAELIEDFRQRGPLSRRAHSDGFRYPDPLWGPEGIDVLLLGQGVPWAGRGHRPADASPGAEALRNRRAAWCVWLDEALPAAEALRCLHTRPALLESLAEAFRRHGPASAVLAERAGAPSHPR